MDNLERLVVRKRQVIAHFAFAVSRRTVLRGDEDDTVRTPVTIDCAGSGILEDIDGSDVGRIDIAQALFHTVHKDERTRRVERTGTADEH